MPEARRLAIVGYGKMGRLIEGWPRLMGSRWR